MKMNVAARIRRKREMYALGEKMFFFRGGPHDFACATCHGDDDKRIRLQDLPNLTTKRGRAEGVHDVARVPRVAGRAAHVPVAPERLLPPAALPRARVTSRRVDRADDVPRAQRQRRRVRRAGDQALRPAMTPCDDVSHGRCWRAASLRRLRDRAVATTRDRARRRRDDEGVVQGERPGGARPPRPGRDAEAVQRVRGKALPKDVAREDREDEPRDDQVAGRRQVLGDWKNGERIAQEGRGKQFTDDPDGPVGGNCYACHQLTPQEVSFGTIGPPLYHFGKLRGYTDDTRKYAYGKIYNAEAYTACSNMPRFGHKRHPDRAADQGRRRAADGSGVAGQQVSATRGDVIAARLPAGARRRAAARAAASTRALRADVARDGAAFYDSAAAVRQREPAALHRLPRAAAAGPLPRAERQPRRRRGRADSRRISSARHLLKRFGIAPRHARRARVHVPRFRRGRAALRHDGRLRAPRDAGQAPAGRRGPARCCSTAATRGRARRRRCGRAGQDMIDAQKLLGVDIMTGHWEFTYGAERVKQVVDKRFRGQDRIPRAEREDRRLRRPGVQAVRRCARSTACPSPSSARRFPYTPIANPRYFVPDWTFGIQEEELQKVVDEARAQGRAGRRAAVAQRHGRRPQARVARDAASTRSSAATRTTACRSRRSSTNRGGKTLVTNAGSNGKFLARARPRRARRQGRRLPLSRCCRCSPTCCRPTPRWRRYIAKVRAPFAAKLAEKLAVTEGLLYRRGNFNGTLDQLILDALMAVKDARDRVLARIPLGHVAAAGRGDHDAST